MLSKFDWLRRCRTGTELLTTLILFSKTKNTFLPELVQGAPFSAIGKLCPRCNVYAPASDNDKYCQFCKKVQSRMRIVASKSPKSLVIWGYLNRVPQQLRENKTRDYIHGIYVHDGQRFLLMMKQWKIRQWLQEMVIYYGMDIKGLIQIFPTVGEYRNLNMGDYLSWAIHHEANFSFDQLRIRFYTAPSQLINPKEREKEGLLTFNIAEFLSLLEMAEVFRANLRPEEQKNLYELLNLKDSREEQFYWGRFLGQLTQETKDMLDAWKIRQWPKNRIKFLYKLINYVVLPK